MTATYVNNLRVAEPGNGDENWGVTTNTSLEIIGEALGIGSEAITTNADTHTSTVADGASDQARAFHLKYTGTLDSACTITIAPNTMKRVQIIENATSGGHSIIISQGSGANVTILNSTKKIIYLDGAGSGAAVVDVTTASFGSQAFYVPAGSTGNRPTGVAGAFRYNSTTSEFEGYTSSWGSIGGSGATNVSLTEATGNGSTTAFTLSTAPGTENNTQVYIDGVYQEKGTYAVSGSTLTFSTAPPNGTSIEVTGFSESSVGTPGDGTVTLAKMAANSVDSPQYVDGSIDLVHMSANSVDSDQYVDGSIDTAHIADSQITVAKMAANSVDSDQYVDGSIDTAHIADDQVTGAKLANSVDVTTGVTVGGASNGVAITNGQIALKNSGTVSKLDFYCEQSNAHYTRLQSAPHGSYSGNVVLTLPASDGDAGQVLSTNGSGVTSWITSGGLYDAWSIITSATNLASGGQYISNSSSALTHTLASGSAGSTIVIKNNGSGLVTIARTSSQKINGAAADATMPQGNAVQLVYVDSTTGWLVL